MKFVAIVKPVSVVFCVVIMFTGCISFPKNQLPIADLPKPSEEDKKPTVTYSFTSGFDWIEKREHNQMVNDELAKEFAEVLKETGYFGAIDRAGDGDLNMRVRLVIKDNPLAIIPATITGFTLFIIPSWTTTHYHITVVVQDGNKKEFNYQLSDAVKNIAWLPLVVAMPFMYPKNVTKEIRKNIWRNLILKMQADGLLPQPMPVP